MFTALIAAALLQTTAPTEWLIDDTTSALDQQRTYLAGWESDEPIINVIGRPEKAMLILTCAADRRKVALQWPAFLGRDQVYVDWKVGDGEIKRSTFYLMSGTSAQIQGRDAETMLTAFRSEQPLAIRVHGRGVQEATFSLAGAGQQIDVIEEACPARRRR